MPDDDARFAPPSTADDDTLDNLADEMEALADEPDADEKVEPAGTAEPDIHITPAENDALDVDSALEAVSGLDDMIAAQEAEERAEQERREHEARAEQERREIEARAQQAEEARVSDILENPMPTPARLVLRRGSIASVLPGAALVGVGVWLTVAFTTGTPPAPTLTAGVLAGLGVLALVSAWLGSGRWARGALFLALWGVLSAGAVVYAATMLGAALVLPALLVAAGGAVVLAAFLGRPASGKHALPGVLLLVAGAAAAAVMTGIVPPQVISTLGAVWIPVAVVMAILLLLPLVVRR